MRGMMARWFPQVADATALREASRVDQGGIYDGTVGWDDGADHFDLDDTSGVTLVKVTLFKGHNATTDGEKTTARARGTRILCRIGAPLFNVPPDGAQVVVAMPADRMLVPGGGVIISQVIASPGTQFSATKAKMDFGPDFDLVIKARTITLTDYEDRYLTIGPKFGFKIGDADANGCQLKNDQWLFYTTDGAATPTAVTTFQLSRDNGIGFFHNDGKKTAMSMKGGEWIGIGDSFKAMFGAGYLGVATTPVPTAGIAYSIAGPANVVSPSWYVSTT